MAINSRVLTEMEIPTVYLETLPKVYDCISQIMIFAKNDINYHALEWKACLGDIIYRYITADQFSPECLLDCLDLSTEHQTLKIANRIEAAVHVWRQKN
ncbi:hypothetical protein PTKIN_Ptkin10aG0168300 [Pterospermum kingtungense]